MKKIVFCRIAVAILPLLFVFIVLFKSQIICLTKYFPDCEFYALTGYLCPACGNTRSILSLLDGHILYSIGYNPTPVIILGVAMSFYIELIAMCFGVRIKIFPRSYVFLGIILGAVSLYYVLRNILSFLTIC